MDDSFQETEVLLWTARKLVKTETLFQFQRVQNTIHAQTDMNIIGNMIGESISVKDKHIFLETF